MNTNKFFLGSARIHSSNVSIGNVSVNSSVVGSSTDPCSSPTSSARAFRMTTAVPELRSDEVKGQTEFNPDFLTQWTKTSLPALEQYADFGPQPVDVAKDISSVQRGSSHISCWTRKISDNPGSWTCSTLLAEMPHALIIFLPISHRSVVGSSMDARPLPERHQRHVGFLLSVSHVNTMLSQQCCVSSRHRVTSSSRVYGSTLDKKRSVSACSHSFTFSADRVR